MELKDRGHGSGNERMPDWSFRMMNLTFKAIDLIFSSYIDKRIKNFQIKEGFTVVDYGCGPGRYSTRISRIVGENGRVFAVDIHNLAIEEIKKKIAKYGIKNIVPVLADGYNSKIKDNTADVVCVIDMFFGINNTTGFLKELYRITKKDGFLIIDDGHQPRGKTRKSINESGLWEIYEDIKDHLKCRPV